MEVNEFKIRIQDEKHSWLTSCGKSEIWNDYSTTLMVNLLIQFNLFCQFEFNCK